MDGELSKRKSRRWPGLSAANYRARRLVHLFALSESGWVFDEALPGTSQIIVNVGLRFAFYSHDECPQRGRYFDPRVLGTLTDGSDSFSYLIQWNARRSKLSDDFVNF
jgi:hypothetical protein